MKPRPLRIVALSLSMISAMTLQFFFSFKVKAQFFLVDVTMTWPTNDQLKGQYKNDLVIPQNGRSPKGY